MLKKFLILVLLIFVIFFIYFYKSLDSLSFEDDSLVSFDRNNELLSLFVNSDDNFKIPIDSNSKFELLENLVLLYEDRRFYSHLGVDFLAILRALKVNFLGGKLQGASTISMQTIKLGFKAKDRNLFIKIKESLQAIFLELKYSKKEILNLYLNNAPYGRNIVGAKTAAFLYFNKDLDALNPAQAALLAVLPHSPSLLTIDKIKLKHKRDYLLKLANKKGLINDESLELALITPLPTMNKTNSIAPHFSHFLAKNNPLKKSFKTTIDKHIQEKLEFLVKNYSNKISNKDISNISLILINAHDSNIVSYIGSQDFFDIEHYGQIDGVLAKRNTGSTLKPFLYALSLDSGLITPSSLLVDSENFYGSFNPQNASRTFSGKVQAKVALRESLNVPFVNLLIDYGVDKFLYFLNENLNLNDLDSAKYGLSLILGAKELSLLDLSKLYLMLRNGGEKVNINLDSATKVESKQNITDSILPINNNFSSISNAASKLTLQALLDIYLDFQSAQISHKIAWKSGTSYGNNDSWAIGVSDKYVLCVWSGNFNKHGSIALKGRDISGRIMFEVFSLLNSIEEFRDFSAWREIGKWQNNPPLRKVKIDEFGYRSLDSTKTEFMPKLAPPLRFAPQNIINENKARIIYPVNNLVIQKQNKIIAKINNKNKDKFYYFLNGEFIGENNKSSIDLTLKTGNNQLYIINQKGESDLVTFRVLD